MQIKTWNTLYTINDGGDGGFLISGHEKYCPTPVLVTLKGEPKVGERIQFTYCYGHRKGETVTTTPVVSVS